MHFPKITNSIDSILSEADGLITVSWLCIAYWGRSQLMPSTCVILFSLPSALPRLQVIKMITSLTHTGI